MGPVFKELQQVEESTGKTPSELEEQPELWEDLRPAWDAWRVLNEGRMDMAPIALAEIRAYAQIHGVEAIDLIDKIRGIEREYRRVFLDQREKGLSKKTTHGH